VTIQGDPRAEDLPANIIAAAEWHRRLGENFMAKIPVTAAGIEAIERVLDMGVAVCATEVFSIAQAVRICQVHERFVRRTGRRLPFYVTHITGILDEYLQRVAKRDRIDIPAEVLAQAGCAVGRKEYHLLRERGYQAVMLGGGAAGRSTSPSSSAGTCTSPSTGARRRS